MRQGQPDDVINVMEAEQCIIVMIGVKVVIIDAII
jgi:hypothetical protein